MPSKIYVAVTIALVALTAFVTSRLVGSGGADDAAQELRFRVKNQCDSWSRELQMAADAYDAQARTPTAASELPLGATLRERALAAARLMSEQKFCRSVRKRDGSDVGGDKVDLAGAAFVQASDPSQLAQAVRSLADAAKSDSLVEIGP